MNTRLPLLLSLLLIAVTLSAWRNACATPLSDAPQLIRVLITRLSASQPLTLSGPDLQYRTVSGEWKALGSSVITVPACATPLTPTESVLPADALKPIEVRCPATAITVQQSEKTFTYRGELRVDSARSTIVNTLSVEDYLRGVVPSEMPVSFPLEALKAQAVAARSYALASLGKHRDSGADVCDVDQCQAYRGASAETQNTDCAVFETKGEALVVGTRVLSAMYSADCGGSLAGMDQLGPSSVQPDCSEDGKAYCLENPRHEWEARFPVAEVLRAAKETKAVELMAIEIASRDESGRAVQLRLTHDQGQTVIDAKVLRRTLGSSRMRSLLCTVSLDSNAREVVFSGQGWGHGAGLCQWGARGMALSSSKNNYQAILAHYYPGATLQKLKKLAMRPRDAAAKKSVLRVP